MKEKLKALFHGKPLVDSDENILFLKGVELGKKDGLYKDTDGYELSELENFEVYVNPLQKEIDRLMLVIQNQQGQITKLMQPKGDGRKFHRHLTKEEVLEIENIFKLKPKTDIELIISTYSSSYSVIHNIINHTHSKSSPRPITA